MCINRAEIDSNSRLYLIKTPVSEVVTPISFLSFHSSTLYETSATIYQSIKFTVSCYRETKSVDNFFATMAVGAKGSDFFDVKVSVVISILAWPITYFVDSGIMAVDEDVCH